MDLLTSLKTKVKEQKKTIVFPEGNDQRVVRAAVRLAKEELLTPIILGEKAMIEKTNGAQVPAGVICLDPQTYPTSEKDKMIQAFVTRRNGKNTVEEAQKLLTDVNYFATMLVYLGQADGMVSGAIHSTGETVRPALQIIKTKPNVSRTSGAFVMLRGEERYVFADCAINIDPSAKELAEIALESAKTARLFDIEPRIALLSFSTKGSAKSPVVDKVKEAVELAHELAPEERLDGELQFDAAFVPDVATKKDRKSVV